MTGPSAEFRAALADRYEIERELGAGGMAHVYLARDLKHDRHVALKVLRPEIALGLGPEHFVREIRVAAHLQHPHILPLFDSGQAAGLLYYVAPYIEGESLQQRLARERQLPLDDALQIARQVGGALDYAHARGVIHRDIKPGNILLEGDEAIVADFGIALAVAAAGGGERITSSGMVVGTPAYMSPEQAAGGADLDRRSDVYSLGCVLYEMLAGEPPFSSPTPEAIRARQLHDTPPPLSVLRATVSLEVEGAVSRALAKSPADRYRTAGVFVATLTAPRRTAEGAAGAAGRRWPRRAWRVGAAAVLLGAAALIGRRALTRERVDPGLHVVLPFAMRSGVAAEWMTGDQIESLLYDAMEHWGDVRVVGEIRAHDAWSRARDTVPSLRSGLEVARTLGAGLLLTGEAGVVGDSIALRAGLYDVQRGGSPVQEQEVRFPLRLTSVTDVGGRIYDLVARLLVRRRPDPTTVHESLGTTFLSAWQPYLAGTEALGHLEVERAESLFREAVRADPEFARAHLALAEAADWADRPTSEWVVPARAAVTYAARLSSARDSALAWGLLQLAEGDYPHACDQFRAALRRDSLDVSAWFGLGECQRRDTMVVRDRRAAGGWRFRSSYEGAVRAYRRALEIAPSFNLAFGSAAYDRLARLLLAERYLIRWGSALAPDTGAFLAWPALDHDTLVLRPVPAGEAQGASEPRSHAAAVERGRAMLREAVERWVVAFPWNARAHGARAVVLELQGQLREEGSGRQSALYEVHEALRLETEPELRTRLVLDDVRLRLKLREFGAARRLADSLLRMADPSGPAEAFDLACAAALLGRARLAAELMARSATDSSFRLPPGSPVDLLRPATAAALRLQGYASLGAPLDSIRTTEARVDTLVRRWVDRGQQAGVRQALLSYASLLAFPVRGWSEAKGPPDGWFITDAQWLLARGETTAARARLAPARREQAGFTSGDVLPALAHQEAYVLAAVRDTAAAEAFLDLSLENLEAAPTMLIAEPAQAGGLVRAMALRSQLAARRGDGARARHWAAAVDTLWSGGDPELRAVAGALKWQ